METICGKSMLGSLYLSILLISCLSIDFGSAGTLRNSSEEEIEGFIYKDNYYCYCPDVGIYGFNLDEVLNECTTNAQCECVIHIKETKHYWGCGTSELHSLPDYEAWIKAN